MRQSRRFGPTDRSPMPHYRDMAFVAPLSGEKRFVAARELPGP
jgi:hypothetical protein